MEWQTETIEKPIVRFVLKNGPLDLTVREAEREEDSQWQHFIMSFGAFSEESAEECMRTWPREALQKARAALDELEASLDTE